MLLDHTKSVVVGRLRANDGDSLGRLSGRIIRGRKDWSSIVRRDIKL